MLSLSTKGRYAVRIMVYLTVAENGKPIQKHRISDSEGISQDYVEQILVKLKTDGLVTSHRGKKGGFTLGRRPENITVEQVIEAAEGRISIVPCLSSDQCERMTMCVTQPVWKEATEALKASFSAHTIAELAEQASALRDSAPPTYSI